MAEDLLRIAAASVEWDRLRGKTILVTGAGGFLGGWIVRSLLALEMPLEVVATGRDVARLREKLSDVDGSPRLTLKSMDLCAPTIPEVRADYFIHAASIAQTAAHRRDPIGTIGPNVFGTQALLEAASRCEASGFLFVSSGAVYGQIEAGEGARIPEETAGRLHHLDTASAYGESKRMGELLCRVWSVQRGLATRIVRLGHTYGPGLDESDERIFADFVFRVVRNKNLVLHSRGEAVRPFCYATDAVTGLFTVLLRGAIGEAYNLVNPDAEISMLELAHLMRDLFPERGLHVEVRGGASSSNQKNVQVCTKKIETLGWKPMVGLADGFRRTVQSYSS